METILERNLHALARSQPGLAQRLAVLTPDPCWRVESAQDGSPSLCHLPPGARAVWLHSRFDPKTEARRRVAALEAQPCLVFLGAGLGYGPLAAYQARQTQLVRMLLIEADPQVLHAALRTLDWRPLLCDLRVSVCLTDSFETLNTMLQEMVGDFLVHGLQLVEHPPSVRLFPTAYAQAGRWVRDCVRRTATEVSFTMRRGVNMQENTLRNLPVVARALPLDRLQGLVAGRPAAVVAAGPSLHRNVAQLADVVDRLLIIVVDTSIRVLLERGIVPHLAVAIDPLERNLRHFERLEPYHECLANVPLVIDQELYFRIPLVYPGPLLLSPLDKCETCRWTNALLHTAKVIPKGTNVGQTAINTAAFLGASPILLMGFDLAFDPETGLTHAAGTALVQKIDPHAPADSPRITWIDGVLGKPVPTDATFLHFLQAIERDIATFSVPVIDATEGGARIAGTTVLPLAQALAALPRQPWMPGAVVTQALRAAQQPAIDWRAAARTVLMQAEQALTRARTLHTQLRRRPQPDLCAAVRALQQEPAVRIVAEQALAAAHVHLMLSLGELAGRSETDPAVVAAHVQYLEQFQAVVEPFSALLAEIVGQPDIPSPG